MESTTVDNKRVSLHFYHGRSGPPPNYIRIQGMVEGSDKSSIEKFGDLLEADEWAAQLGVQRWNVVQHTRAFPEAARIPITFAEAPDIDRLQELIAKFESGIPLAQLAEGVMIETGDRRFQVSPYLLRLWLIGAAPEHPALQCLKRKRFAE